MEDTRILELEARLAVAEAQAVKKPGHIVVTDIIGDGKNDPFRADFPTYEIVAWDFAHGKMIVFVPEGHIPHDQATESEIHARLDEIHVGPDSVHEAGRHTPVVHVHYRQVK